MQIEMIVAVAENGVIGKDGDMPWRLPTDLQRFKQVTMGLPIIMGRRTWESLGRALPGRLNIVISSQALALPDGAVLVSTPAAALDAAGAAARVMIIGGGQIYKAFEAQADIVHLTMVHARPDGDTHFALDTPDDWQETALETVAAGDKDSADMSFVTLVRKT